MLNNWKPWKVLELLYDNYIKYKITLKFSTETKVCFSFFLIESRMSTYFCFLDSDLITIASELDWSEFMLHNQKNCSCLNIVPTNNISNEVGHINLENSLADSISLVNNPLNEPIIFDSLDNLSSQMNEFIDLPQVAPHKQLLEVIEEPVNPTTQVQVFFQETLPEVLQEGANGFLNLVQRFGNTVEETIETVKQKTNEVDTTPITEKMNQVSNSLNQFSVQLQGTWGNFVQKASENIDELVNRVHPQKSVVPVLSSKFIADVNMPDFTQVLPEASFVKTWRIQNDGSDWPENCYLQFIGGNNTLCTDNFPYPLPSLKANGTIEISLNMKAPSTEGKASAYFRIAHLNHIAGEILFGDPLWCTVSVVSPQPAVPQQPPFAYEEQLRTITEMGFDAEIAKVLLVEHKGDLEAVLTNFLQ